MKLGATLSSKMLRHPSAKLHGITSQKTLTIISVNMCILFVVRPLLHTTGNNLINLQINQIYITTHFSHSHHLYMLHVLVQLQHPKVKYLSSYHIVLQAMYCNCH